MKRKYYMRGLGIGILITTLVFSFVNPSGPTDAEVIKRAEELGYVLPETDTTPGLNLDELREKETPVPTKAPEDTPVPTETMSATPVPTRAEEPSDEPTVTPTEKPTEPPTPTPSEEPIATETPMPTETPTETPTPTIMVVKAQITIVKGSTATKICRLIEEAGIIGDWEDLRDYLKSRDLVDEVNVGTFALSSDMSFEEITKIITGK